MFIMSSPNHKPGIICLSPLRFISCPTTRLYNWLAVYASTGNFFSAFDHDELKNKAALFQNSAQCEYKPSIAVIIYCHLVSFQQLIHLIILWFNSFHSWSLSSLFWVSSTSWIALTYYIEYASSLVYYPTNFLSIFIHHKRPYVLNMELIYEKSN